MAVMSEEQKDGGPAFPMAKVTVLAEDGTPNEACAVMHDGMTLRDYFAAEAMSALLRLYYPNFTVNGEVWTCAARTCAARAYEVADVMLETRNRRPE